jgi:hypothetical protein
MLRELSLKCGANLTGDLVISRRRPQPCLINHPLGRCRPSYPNDLSPRRLRINLSTNNDDFKVVMNRNFVLGVFYLLLYGATD